MTEPDLTAVPAPKPPNLLVERARFLGIGLAIGLAIGGAGTLWVWWTGQAEVRALEDVVETERRSADAAKNEHRAALSAEQTKVAILGARVEIARAIHSLDQLNYGLVGERLRAAGELLKDVDGGQDIAARLQLIQVDPLAPDSARASIQPLAAAVDALLTREP